MARSRFFFTMSAYAADYVDSLPAKADSHGRLPGVDEKLPVSVSSATIQGLQFVRENLGDRKRDRMWYNEWIGTGPLEPKGGRPKKAGFDAHTIY